MTSLMRWLPRLALAAFPVAALSAQTPAIEKSATAFYLEYRAAFDKATRIEEMLPYLAAANRKQIEATPAAERAGMFEFIKAMNVTDVRVTGEERTATGATLTVEGLDPMEKRKSSGTIQLVREDGAWKLAGERWGSAS